MWDPTVRAAGSRLWQPFAVNQQLVLTCHDPLPLSSPACDDAWRRFMAKWFCGSGFAVVKVPRGVLDLRSLRSRTALLQPRLPQQARLQQRRSANCRHQQSPEGRLDHRDRQREYRLPPAQAQRAVTDQGSVSIISPAPFDCGGPMREASSTPPPPGRECSRRCGCAARSAARRTFRRSISTHSTTKVSLDDQSRKPARRFAATFTPSTGRSARLPSELGVHPGRRAPRHRERPLPARPATTLRRSIPIWSSSARLSISIRACAPRASTR